MPMPRRFTVAYLVMDGWMVLGVAIRLYLQLSHGMLPDLLPFITATLAVAAGIAIAATRRAPVGFYIALASWDFIGSAARVTAQIAGHQPLDGLPVVSVAVGLAGLIVLFTSTPRTPQETP